MELPKGGIVAKAVRLAKELGQLRIGLHAANTGYFLTLSSFPTLVLLMGLLKFTRYDAADLMALVEGVIPAALLPELQKRLQKDGVVLHEAEL